MARKKKIKKYNKQDRLRLSVFRSQNNIFAQIINDIKGCTVASVSSLKISNGSTVAAAKQVGLLIGELAVKNGCKAVVFDPNHRYHGRIKALADGARESGLVI